MITPFGCSADDLGEKEAVRDLERQLRNSQLTRMCDLSLRDGTDGGRFYRRNSRRLAVKCHELDFESLAVGVDMNHGPDVTT